MTTTYVIDGSGRSTIDKDPSAVLDYSIDWSEWLTAVSDTISTFTVVTTGVTVVSSSFVGAITTAWLSGGTLDDKVQVTFRITTTGGRTDDRSIYLKIKER